MIIKRSRPARPLVASPRLQVAEMQRSRLLSAAVVTVEELGWSGASVAHVTSRARVSRRTFYDLFANREECLLAVLEDVLERIEAELSAADVEGLSWRERVRTGLFTVLSFFDREPVPARVCVVHVLQGGPRVLARREEILAGLAGVLDQGRDVSARAGECPSLTAEGLVGAALGIVYARLVADRPREPLTGLLGELMGMIVLPYLGPAAARREQACVAPRPSAATAGVGGTRVAGTRALVDRDPLADLPMRLTYRTARVLDVIAERPFVSNRVVAELAGVSDQGQISKLLARLERLGLIRNQGGGHAHGERNAWCLTGLGERVTRQLSLTTGLHEDVGR